MSLYYGADPSRFGNNSANSTSLPDGGNNDLFLKVFAGEVITTFEEMNTMLPLHRVRTISNGKSASFPVAGVAGAKYHVPGESMMNAGIDTGSDDLADASKYLQKPNASERLIYIDDLLVSSTFIANIDEAKNHYDIRSIYSTEIGRALSYVADKNLIRTVIAGARADKDRFGGTDANYLGAAIQASADGTVDATEMADAIVETAQKMDEKSVPSEGRYAILTPAHYYTLMKGAKDYIDRDYAGEGSLAQGVITSVAGVQILKSNHIPSGGASATEIHADAGVMNDVFDTHDSTGTTGTGYGNASFANTVGIAFQTEAVGTVKLMDLAVETEYSVDRQGTLLATKYAMGHGVLREECCFEITHG